MDHSAHAALLAANLLYARATNATEPASESRPAVYKPIGIALAIGSGVFIGVSFVLKKIGLLKANEKYEEEPGEGYGYLKNAFWWAGMVLMIVGEVMNAGAYAFVDAILVAPMGALSVVVTTILSAIFLKERLSLVGKIGCFLCILGSVVIAMNSPSESSVANIEEMQKFVIQPGFLSFGGVVLIACAVLIFWAGPKYGKKTMMVYLAICSLTGGLSVVCTQGFGAAIIAQISGKPQFNHWFIYVLMVFVVFTLVVEIIYLNVSLPSRSSDLLAHGSQKALNLYNAALVTPTYYVIFTSCTIITSIILFKGFKGTPTSIITVVLGFFTICAGVVLLQLSKSAKDVPDAAVFAGDLDQVRTIAEQEQSELEPKADAIRGAAAIVRRISQVRDKMQLAEVKRLHDEKQQDLAPIGENEHVEWDGLRRRRTTFGTNSVHSRRTTPFSEYERQTPIPRATVQHPPLGMSRFPTDDDDSDHENDRPGTASSLSFFQRARSIVSRNSVSKAHPQSSMHPVPLTEISVPNYKVTVDHSPYGHDETGHDHTYGVSHGKTEYQGAGGERHITIVEDHPRLGSSGSLHPSMAPTPPPHSARRQFSFQNVFRQASSQSHARTSSEDQQQGHKRHNTHRFSTPAIKGATEEERLGLVKGKTNPDHHTTLPPYEDEDEEDESQASENRARPRSDSERSRDLMWPRESVAGGALEEVYYDPRRYAPTSTSRGTGRALPPPPPEDQEPGAGGGRGAGRGGAFV